MEFNNKKKVNDVYDNILHTRKYSQAVAHKKKPLQKF